MAKPRNIDTRYFDGPMEEVREVIATGMRYRWDSATLAEALQEAGLLAERVTPERGRSEFYRNR